MVRGTFNLPAETKLYMSVNHMAYLSEDGTEDLTFILFQSCTSVTISKFIPGLLQKKENVAVKIGLHRNVL